MTTSLQQSGGATLGLTIDQRCGRAPPRLHPGITQKVAPNESQRGPKSLTPEVLIYDGLFVACWIWCPFGKGS